MTYKKIIVIGASSGIGKELALLYAKEGHQVAITGRRNELLQSIQQTFPNTILTATFDVMQNENLVHLHQLIKQLNGLDLLIYNAGFGQPAKEVSWEIDRTTIDTNVRGFAEIVGFAFNYFLQQGKGQIAITSSMAALRGNSWAPAYSASKAFMSNYAEGLNIKASKQRKNVLITDIKPGFVSTKDSKGNAQFWVAPTAKAAAQIKRAIEQRKRVAYITKRWWLIAQLMKAFPYSVYRRIG